MAVALPPSTTTRFIAVGAVGGAVAAAAGLVVAAMLAAARGHMPIAALNAVGAWGVRWLQLAAPQALDNFYWDASLGGLLVALAVGGLGGAVVGGAWAHLSAGGALLRGMALGALLWVATRWGLAPALNPVLTANLPAVALAGACLAYGTVLGLWLGAVTAAAPGRNARRSTAS